MECTTITVSIMYPKKTKTIQKTHTKYYNLGYLGQVKHKNQVITTF